MATIERATTFSAPGQVDSPVEVKSRYENFIGGHWVAPAEGAYSENPTPATGEPFTEVPRSTPEDVELALDAAHVAKDAWAEASTTERSRVRSSLRCRLASSTALSAGWPMSSPGYARTWPATVGGRERERPLPADRRQFREHDPAHMLG